MLRYLVFQLLHAGFQLPKMILQQQDQIDKAGDDAPGALIQLFQLVAFELR